MTKSKKRATNRDFYLLEEFDPDLSKGKYQMPSLQREIFVPSRLIDFTTAIHSRNFSSGIHFYLDDYRFERIWREPYRYIPILRRFACVFTPDFSLYTDMPMAMKIWNVYRSRLIGQMMQHAGIRIIPTVSWAGPETFEFCFDGIEEGCTVTIATVGTMRNPEAQELFYSGMSAMIETVHPSTIIFYGTAPKKFPEGIPYVHFESTSFSWQKSKSDVTYKEIL